MASSEGEPDRLVVPDMVRGVAPAVVATDGNRRQQRDGMADPVRAVKDPDQPVPPSRGGAVAFALVLGDAAAPERTKRPHAARNQHANCGAGLRFHPDRPETGCHTPRFTSK